MLVNKQENYSPLPNSWLRKGITGLVSLGLFALLSTMVLATPWGNSTATPVQNSIVLIGEHFFTDFLLPFELASILLLMAMVGAIILARREYLPPQETSGPNATNCFTIARTSERISISPKRRQITTNNYQ